MTLPCVKELGVWSDNKNSGFSDSEIEIWNESHKPLVTFLESVFPNLKILRLSQTIHSNSYQEISDEIFDFDQINSNPDIPLSVGTDIFSSCCNNFFKSFLFTRKLETLEMNARVNLDEQRKIFLTSSISFSLVSLHVTEEMWGFLSCNCEFPSLNIVGIQNGNHFSLEDWKRLFSVCPRIKKISLGCFPFQLKGLVELLDFFLLRSHFVVTWNYLLLEDKLPKFVSLVSGNSSFSTRIRFEAGSLSVF